ncbi:DEKNAAC102937 [Brettanomyces naardenensis]|uniref:DEKNAAC102937 n=1 Tax=Brettanomyces naardenensis TaxID=13370 RepID=A0A448YLT6_BRENA|nr:DEKNAAC102937 [Brettanomyces naardenensis]
MLLVADPQLIDNHTYPTYNHFALKVSKFTVDNYIYKNYWELVNHLKPDAIVFLGDLLDNGRESSDKYYEHEFDRFNKIFRPKETRERNIDVIMNVPGNHDIGFGSSVISHSVDRFKDHFGQPNQIITKYNHDLISIDTISLSDTKYETIAAESKVFLKTLQEPGELKRPRIIFDHVPFFRDTSKATCGPRRESPKPIPAVAGYQYQTMIDPGISSVVLGMVRPSIIFSGDDHDYCEAVHEYSHDGKTKHAIEINVKSISMAMGIWKPAVELLTLYDKPIEGKKVEVNGEVLEDIPATFEYKMCYLTPPYEDIIFYSIFAFFNFVYLCFFCLKTDKYYTGFAIDEVYKEPKVWDTLKSISTKLLVELVVVESAIVWGVYYGLFSVSYY